MKIKSVEFGNYKAFFERQKLDVRPITILLGKNSSGKSAVAKLFTLLENSLSGNITEPLLLMNNRVSLGSQFRDLVFNNQNFIPVEFAITCENNIKIEVSVLQENESLNLTIYKWNYSDGKTELKLNYENKEKHYVDAQGEKYRCIFNGFRIINITKVDNPKESLFLDVIANQYTIDVDYIGPFRILPQRQFLLSGQIEYRDTGTLGENAYMMLGVSSNLKDNLHEDVGVWYKDNFDDWKLEVKNNNQYHEIILSKGETQTNIVDVGQGMNQALPLVVRSHINRSESTIIIEQPELHLHPAAHGALAELFVKSALAGNQSYIIETHSENFILRLRRLVVDGKFGFKPDDVVIYWVNDSETQGQQLTEITINDLGELNDWPDGVFSENISEIFAMRNSVKKKNIKK